MDNGWRGVIAARRLRTRTFETDDADDGEDGKMKPFCGCRGGEDENDRDG